MDIAIQLVVDVVISENVDYQFEKLLSSCLPNVLQRCSASGALEAFNVQVLVLNAHKHSTATKPKI